MTVFKKLLMFSFLFLIIFSLASCKEQKDDGPIPLDTTLTDKLKLEANLGGKNFITDGVGIVTLNRCVDGDTITVYVNRTSITIRFLGIDTPESTGSIEAWGKEASAYVKNRLQNAESIVLEAEENRIDSTGKRYLAWVWYRMDVNSEYRLLNLEEVEMAYTKYNPVASSKYNEIMRKAHEKAQKSKKRIWGEKDPNFNYSKELIETSLLYMLDNHDKFQSGTKFLVTVRLVRTSGNNMFLEDAYDASYDNDGDIVSGKGGVYAFGAYRIGFYSFYKIGDVFTLQCQLEYEGQFGTQLTGLDNPSVVIENALPEITSFAADELSGGASLEPYYGRVIKVEGLEVTSVKKKTTASGDDYYVVEGMNSHGDIFDIYFGNGLISDYNVPEIFMIGAKYDIIAGVAYYEFANGFYQLAVGDGPRYNKGVLVADDEVRVGDISLHVVPHN